jgi:hypothetical protein
MTLTTAVVWVRSYANWDVLQYRESNIRVVRLCSELGKLVAYREQSAALMPEYSPWHEKERAGLLLVSHPMADLERRSMELGAAPIDSEWFTREFNWKTWREYRTAYFPKCSMFILCLPHWFVVVLGLLLTAFFASVPRAIRQHRRSRGCCERCGYDLRESPERCPECGTPRPAVVAAGVPPVVRDRKSETGVALPNSGEQP